MNFCITCLEELSKKEADPNLFIVIGKDSDRKNYQVCNRCAQIIRKNNKDETLACIRHNLKYLKQKNENLSSKNDSDNSEEMSELSKDLPSNLPLF